MSDDNWSDRKSGMICETCMFYTPGRCRKRAPTLNGWPAVWADDWCGDHKLDKEKLVSEIQNEPDENIVAPDLK